MVVEGRFRRLKRADLLPEIYAEPSEVELEEWKEWVLVLTQSTTSVLSQV